MSRPRGFKNVVVAKVLKNTATEYVCDTPIKLFRGISGKINVKRNSEKTYSDDAVEEVLSSFDSVEIELEGDSLENAKHALIYGSTLKDGILDEATTDEAAEVAIGFMVKTKKGYNFHWYFCGKFSDEDSDEFETKQDKVSPKTKTIKGTFYGRELDQKFRRRVNEEELINSDENAKKAIENWFKEVPLQTTATPSTIEVEYSAYTTGTVANISISGVTFNEETKKFSNVPSNTTTFTFKVNETTVTATLTDGTWNFA